MPLIFHTSGVPSHAIHTLLGYYLIDTLYSVEDVPV